MFTLVKMLSCIRDHTVSSHILWFLLLCQRRCHYSILPSAEDQLEQRDSTLGLLSWWSPCWREHVFTTSLCAQFNVLIRAQLLRFALYWGQSGIDEPGLLEVWARHKGRKQIAEIYYQYFFPPNEQDLYRSKPAWLFIVRQSRLWMWMDRTEKDNAVVLWLFSPPGCFQDVRT